MIVASSFFLILLSSPSPFEVQVSPEAGPQKVRAWGPGLHEGVVGKSADFIVESIGPEVGSLGNNLTHYTASFQNRCYMIDDV